MGRWTGTDFSALVGFLLWLAMVACRPISPLALDWARQLVLLAPLVIVPLAWSSVQASTRETRLAAWPALGFVGAGLALAIAFSLPPGLIAGLAAIPWVLATLVIAGVGIGRILANRTSLSEIAMGAGFVYLGVGGAWTLADRLDYRPLDFDPILVFLTAAHFHFAGFLLPTLTGLAWTRRPGKIATLAAALVVLGTPMVALGITATKLGGPVVIELFGSQVMAIGGLLAGFLHLRSATSSHAPPIARMAWAVAGLSLVCTMVLASLYGLRWLVPLDFLSIPWMQAVHGTTNVLGFGLAGVLGWRLARSESTGQPRTLAGT